MELFQNTYMMSLLRQKGTEVVTKTEAFEKL